MQSEPLHIGVVQLTSNEDSEGNTARALLLMTNLKSQNPDLELVVLPENALYLRVEASEPQKMVLSDPSLLDLHKWAKAHECAVVVGSVLLREESGVFNSMIWLDPLEGSPRVVYRKVHLFDVDVPGAPSVRESAHCSAGDVATIFSFKGWRIGLSICYDVRFSDLYLQYARSEVDLVLVPSAFLVPTGREHWHTLLRARAIESQMYVVAPAQAGTHRGVSGGKRETFGHSLIIDPWGKILVEASGDLEEAHSCRLSKSEIQRVRGQIPMKSHRKIFAQVPREICILFVVVGLCFAFGESKAEITNQKDFAEASERAKKRLYPGGIDEEDLQVQRDLNITERKITLDGLEKKLIPTVLEGSPED